MILNFTLPVWLPTNNPDGSIDFNHAICFFAGAAAQLKIAMF